MEAIQEEMGNLVRDVHDTDAFVRAFLVTDDRIQDEAGCTATCVTLSLASAQDQDQERGGEIAIRAANVGDSMAYMAYMANVGAADVADVADVANAGDAAEKTEDAILTLTQDHRLSNPEERGRLQSHGVIPEGESNTYRLYGLNLARALGDRFLKDEDLGLSAEPHVSDVITLGDDQEALIVIASDGLWDVISADDAMALARRVDRESHGGVVKVAAALAREAEALGSKDDVTVVACRVWSTESVANFSGAFGSKRSSILCRQELGGDGGRREGTGDDHDDDDDDVDDGDGLGDDVDDDLAVGFGGMLL